MECNLNTFLINDSGLEIEEMNLCNNNNHNDNDDDDDDDDDTWHKKVLKNDKKKNVNVKKLIMKKTCSNKNGFNLTIKHGRLVVVLMF